MSQTAPRPAEAITTLVDAIEALLPVADRHDFEATLAHALGTAGIEAYVRTLKDWQVYATLRADGKLADALDYRPWGIGSEADAIMDEAHRDHGAGRVFPLD